MQVEDTVYKVLSKPFIEKSVVFRDILSATQPKTYEGLVDNKPILFEDVKGVDWEFLLSVLLEPSVRPFFRQPCSVHLWTVSQAVFHLSTGACSNGSLS